ncbi:MAG: hypothetical protein DMG57_39460 [Acidobacteria bacterium]|nr:MAG: hypothetical protein DMG57_39460 [Acidobacteriota bacterium]
MTTLKTPVFESMPMASARIAKPVCQRRRVQSRSVCLASCVTSQQNRKGTEAPLSPAVSHILLSRGEGERHGYALRRDLSVHLV